MKALKWYIIACVFLTPPLTALMGEPFAGLAFLLIYGPLALTALCGALGGAAYGAHYPCCALLRLLAAYADPFQADASAFARKAGDVYEDHSRRREVNVAHRCFLFGPCFYAVGQSLRLLWQRSMAFPEKINTRIQGKLSASSEMGKFMLILLLRPFQAAMYAALFLAGLSCTALLLAYGLLLALAAAVQGMVMAAMWCADRFVLWVHSSMTLCQRCKRTYRIPHFICTCGRRHERLYPSPYGVFSHRCLCGEHLPTTLMGGRARIKGSCPHCRETVVATDAAQYGLSLVGGTSSGKTVLLAAFYHLFISDIRRRRKLGLEIPHAFQDAFQHLEDLYNGRAQVLGTPAEDTSRTYSIILSGGEMNNVTQFSLFDVAGESFARPDLGSLVYTNEMLSSNGVIIVVDPLSSPLLAAEAAAEGCDVSSISPISAATVINHFVQHLSGLPGGPRPGTKLRRPVAVVITKLDYPCIRRRLNHMQIGAALRRDPVTPAIEVQDALCRRFLDSVGLGDVLTALDAAFSCFHFFPSSARGDIAPGEPFEPDAYVQQPIQWIIRETDAALADALELPESEIILRGYHE